SLVGLLLCIAGLGFLFLIVIRYVYNRLVPVQNETTPGSGTLAQQMANNIRGGIVFLFMAGGLLAFAHEASLDAFGRGILYGLGLVLLLTGISALNNIIAMSATQKAARS
ncbi:MAG: hypothetical protein ABI324_07820, partial [Ktedonobacteraceae bacterium]